MKKKLYFILALAVVAVFAVSGFTYAMFTDQATNEAKTFTTGTVDIDSYRDGFDTIPGPMFYTTAQEGATPTDPSFDGLKPVGEWVPGKTVVRSLVVYNQGSLDAVLDQIKAEIQSDPKNMASQMDVAVYKILPQILPDGTPFAPIPGDDSMDQQALDQASRLINPLTLLLDAFFDVEDLAQALIEAEIPATAVKLYEGNLGDLTSGYASLSPAVNLKAAGNPFVKRGALLAFVVHMDINAGNEYQGADAVFGFTVNATQARNNP